MMIQDDSIQGTEEDDQGRRDRPSESGDLVRLLKPIIINSERPRHIDEDIVAPRYYNCFNYSLISREKTGVNLTVGITSPNPGEGKTLVAANLAVSLAIANQRETVIVDLNVRSPKIHSVFGTRLSPGLVEAISNRTITVSQTQIKHLYVLSAGSGGGPVVAGRMASGDLSPQSAAQRTSVSLEQVAEFRDVIYSLKQEFEFVIVDMPVLHEPRIPMLLTHQMDGLVVVVDARKTRQEDIDKLLLRVNERQILGFVLNRASEATLA